MALIHGLAKIEHAICLSDHGANRLRPQKSREAVYRADDLKSKSWRATFVERQLMETLQLIARVPIGDFRYRKRTQPVAVFADRGGTALRPASNRARRAPRRSPSARARWSAFGGIFAAPACENASSVTPAITEMSVSGSGRASGLKPTVCVGAFGSMR